MENRSSRLVAPRALVLVAACLAIGPAAFAAGPALTVAGFAVELDHENDGKPLSGVVRIADAAVRFEGLVLDAAGAVKRTGRLEDFVLPDRGYGAPVRVEDATLSAEGVRGTVVAPFPIAFGKAPDAVLRFKDAAVSSAGAISDGKPASGTFKLTVGSVEARAGKLVFASGHVTAGVFEAFPPFPLVSDGKKVRSVSFSGVEFSYGGIADAGEGIIELEWNGFSLALTGGLGSAGFSGTLRVLLDLGERGYAMVEYPGSALTTAGTPVFGPAATRKATLALRVGERWEERLEFDLADSVLVVDPSSKLAIRAGDAALGEGPDRIRFGSIEVYRDGTISESAGAMNRVFRGRYRIDRARIVDGQARFGGAWSQDLPDYPDLEITHLIPEESGWFSGQTHPDWTPASGPIEFELFGWPMRAERFTKVSTWLGRFWQFEECRTEWRGQSIGVGTLVMTSPPRLLEGSADRIQVPLFGGEATVRAIKGFTEHYSSSSDAPYPRSFLASMEIRFGGFLDGVRISFIDARLEPDGTFQIPREDYRTTHSLGLGGYLSGRVDIIRDGASMRFKVVRPTFTPAHGLYTFRYPEVLADIEVDESGALVSKEPFRVATLTLNGLRFRDAILRSVGGLLELEGDANIDRSAFDAGGLYGIELGRRTLRFDSESKLVDDLAFELDLSDPPVRRVAVKDYLLDVLVDRVRGQTVDGYLVLSLPNPKPMLYASLPVPEELPPLKDLRFLAYKGIRSAALEFAEPWEFDWRGGRFVATGFSHDAEGRFLLDASVTIGASEFVDGSILLAGSGGYSQAVEPGVEETLEPDPLRLLEEAEAWRERAGEAGPSD